MTPIEWINENCDTPIEDDDAVEVPYWNIKKINIETF